jgi:hypothetical protein
MLDHTIHEIVALKTVFNALLFKTMVVSSQIVGRLTITYRAWSLIFFKDHMLRRFIWFAVNILDQGVRMYEKIS